MPLRRLDHPLPDTGGVAAGRLQHCLPKVAIRCCRRRWMLHSVGAVEGTAQPQSGRVKPSAGVKGHLFVMTRIVAPLDSVRCTYFKPERKL
jgi:hypothetical protein